MPRLSVEESAMTGFTDKKEIDFTDLTDASTSQTVTYAVAAGDVVSAAGYSIETNFDGGATSELTITVGDGNDANGMLTASSIHEDGTEVPYAINTGILLIGDETVNCARNILYSAADTIDILFTATGANMSALTQGRVTVWFTIRRLNSNTP